MLERIINNIPQGSSETAKKLLTVGMSAGERIGEKLSDLIDDLVDKCFK